MKNSERRKNDFYPTPQVVIETLLDNYKLCAGGTESTIEILEPCAGNGAIIKALHQRGYRNIKAVEIREEEQQVLVDLVGYENCKLADYLEMEIESRPDIIITNPPFSLAMEFLEKSLDIVKDSGKVIFLLRLGFLASDRRFSFMQNNPPSSMYVLHKRPSFTGKGTDSQEYGWFVWDKEKKEQLLKVI